MRMKKLSCLLAAMLMAAGCSPHCRSLETEAAPQMDTLSTSLAEGIQSSHQGTKILVPGEGPLAENLRRQLSERGMLATGENGLSLQCSLEELTDDTGFITIRFTDGTVITRSFRRIREKHSGAG